MAIETKELKVADCPDQDFQKIQTCMLLLFAYKYLFWHIKEIYSNNLFNFYYSNNITKKKI